jgi:hypothetical protein
MGAQKTALNLKAAGDGELTGTASGPEGPREIMNGKVNGESVSWKLKITSPMPMTLEFAGAVEGDKISGSVKAGMFGSFPFSGDRG